MKAEQVTRFVSPTAWIELPQKRYMKNSDWMTQECERRRSHGQDVFIKKDKYGMIAIFRRVEDIPKK